MNGTIIACEVERINSRADGSVAVTLGTSELSPETIAEIFGYRKKAIVAYLSPKEKINQNEIDKVDMIDADLGGKTQSQRLRNVLFKLFEQSSEGHKTFDAYYHHHTEVIINHLKSKIE